MRRPGQPPIRATTARRRAMTFSRVTARSHRSVRRARIPAFPRPDRTIPRIRTAHRVWARSSSWRSHLRRRRSLRLRARSTACRRMRPAPSSQRNPRCCRRCAVLPRSSSRLPPTAAGKSAAACGRSRVRSAACAIDRIRIQRGPS